MDSAGSSPSHSFKDRPRSRHGELSRPALSGLDRKNSSSTAPKSFVSSDKPDPGVRRSYSSCSLDKDKDRENAESPLDSSRTSIRRPFPFKNSTDRFRSVPRVSSVDSRIMPLRGQEPDNGGRPGFRRTSSHGGGDSYRRELSDCSDERDYSASKNSLRKCQDRDRSPDYDDDASKSPKHFPKRENRDAFRINPNREGSHRGKEFSQDAKSPMISPSGTDKRKVVLTLRREKDLADLDDMDVTSPKTKFSSKDEGKNNCASSADTDVRSWNKNSHGAGDADEQWSEANVSQGEAWREVDPLSFSHISKKARSDRDRGRKEEMGNKTRVSDGSEHDATTEKLRPEGVDDLDDKKEGYEKQCDHDSDIKEVKDDAESSCRNPDATSGHSPSKRQTSPSPGDKSDVEEGEVEPEAFAVESCNETSEGKFNDIRLREDDGKQTTAVDCDEASGSIQKTYIEVEGEKNYPSSKTNDIQNAHYDGDNKSDSMDALQVKEHGTLSGFDSANPQSQKRDIPTGMTESPEVKDNQTELQTFDLLDVNKEAKTWNLNSIDQGDFSNKQLTLSLFTKADEVSVQGRSSEPKDHILTASSKSKEVQIGKRTDRSLGAEDRSNGLQHLGVSGGESSQHSGHKQKKLKMDSGLLLSLALPGTSAMAAEGVAAIGPAILGPMEPEKSMQSLNQSQTQTQTQMFSQSQTNSDGFASSFSFSQSQSFIHNPSCSLNCTSVENQELSCGGSRQVSQGTASWPALSGNEQMSNGMHTVTSLSQERSKHRRGIPLYHRILQNGNVHQGFPSVTGSNRSSGSNHVSQRSHQYVPRFQDDAKNVDSNTQDLEASAHQGSTHRDIRERVRQQKAYFASKQQALSGSARSEPNASQSRDKLGDPPAQSTKRATSQPNDDILTERNVLSENIGLHEIATEPVAVMAQKLQELPDSYLDGLKGLAKTTLTSFEKREELKQLQDIIRSRTDLTEDTLLRAHGAQLAILVALKTGMPVYVQGESKLTYKALIDIFLQAKCRNIACQQSLPVGGCECRICSKKSGFCHDCMCVVCYKFDSDNNTCRWVGCDICLHWCHTDCGLRMSYISPTPSTSGTSEMQYHCVACEHKSELFGFVKEVFRNCANVWNAEILARELDCVIRIFHESEDMRGKQLCWQAQQMLKKLENKADAGEVCRSMLRFFNEGSADLDGANMGPNKKAPSVKTNEVTEGQENLPKAATAVGGSKLMDMDKARVVLQNFDCNLEEKKTVAAELQYERARKRAEIEDIESAVRIKQAEAKMFQIRADEACKEAGGLQRIIAAKREKIDEDYSGKYKKLRLSEAEERRRKRFEELQALENAQNDFHKMKIRMEAEIKELLLKMELAKRQFA